MEFSVLQLLFYNGVPLRRVCLHLCAFHWEDNNKIRPWLCLCWPLLQEMQFFWALLLYCGIQLLDHVGCLQWAVTG